MASLAPKVKKPKPRTGDWSVSELEPVTYKTLQVIARGIPEQEAKSLYDSLNAKNDGKLYAFSVNLNISI